MVLLLSKSVTSCRNCVFFKVHDSYEYLGYCINLREVVVLSSEKVPCPQFKEVTLEDLKRVLSSEGFLYCVTCGEYIHTIEELGRHLEKHIIVRSHFSDDVAGEESPVAD